MQEWAARLYVPMKMNRVSWRDVAAHTGLSYQYVSMVINGKENPKGAQERFERAVDELIAEKKAQ